ncbi:MAG: riboflavin synthase [Nitrospinales bacterium]
MFTGIVQTLGTVKDLRVHDRKGRLTVAVPSEFGRAQIGESIAVNGVCLTVVSADESSFDADMSEETLSRTTFGTMPVRSKVNLERSLTPTQKMSGHFVMGHVDRVGTIVQIDHKSGETLFQFEYPEELRPYIVEKGSIAADGISLTVFSCRDRRFSVSIIPYTLAHTNLHERKIGDGANLECDMIGKYVYKACEAILGTPAKGKGITVDMLKEHGFGREGAV